MSDILDIVDDIDDEIFTDDEEIVVDDDDYSEELSTALEEMSEFSENQARELTEAIRSVASATYILLYKAYLGKAHKALGYDTWADYVRDEFDISASRSYQLIDLAKAVKMIEAAAPEGTEIRLTEAQARDIKRELPGITERVAAETKNIEPRDASDVIDEIVREAREQQKADEKVIKEKEKALEQAKQDGYNAGLEAAADAILESDMELGKSGSNDDEDTIDSSEDTLSPSDAMNLYNLMNAMQGIETLPAPDDMVEVIPEDRFDDVYDKVVASAAWFNRMIDALKEARP